MINDRVFKYKYVCRLKDGLKEKISQHDGKFSGGELKKIVY